MHICVSCVCSHVCLKVSWCIYNIWLLTVSINSSVNQVMLTTVMAQCCLLQKVWQLIPISVKRTDSVQSKRKVSSLSDRSDTSEQGGGGEVSGEESPGILSDDQPPESPSDSNDTDDTSKNMPWLKVSVYDFHKYPNLYFLTTSPTVSMKFAD
jgi:hypothetical protein